MKGEQGLVYKLQYLFLFLRDLNIIDQISIYSQHKKPSLALGLGYLTNAHVEDVVDRGSQ